MFKIIESFMCMNGEVRQDVLAENIPTLIQAMHMQKSLEEKFWGCSTVSVLKMNGDQIWNREGFGFVLDI